MAEAGKQSGRRWLWIGAVFVLVAVFFLVRDLLREKLVVQEAQAVRETLKSTENTNGKVEPEKNYDFYSPLATRVKAVYVQAGDKVRPGELMITLDDVAAKAQVAAAESALRSAQAAEYAVTHNGTQAEQQAAQAEIEQDRLARDQAQHDLDALTKLVTSGAASPSEVTAAKERLASAQASLEAAEKSGSNRYSPAEITRAEAAVKDAQSNLEAAHTTEAQTQIYAPAAGTVYSLDAAPTEFAEAGKLLLQMADLTHERIRAYFDEPDLGRLAVGQPIVIKWDAKPGVEWHGHIERLPVTVVTIFNRTVGEVLVQIDGSSDGLLPDTNVTVTVTTSTQPDVLSIPREALHFENDHHYVYKVVGNSLVRTPVTTGTFNVSRQAILSGLKEGDWVATGTLNGQPLQEGVPIKVVR
ncbi:MAG TPA: efflux RND transporter periplasmic adaptor subunit [Terracidiphilus sp.]|nr:efflux RND transporter periplasmic adaptor subunit [Terracidiphilus sp.]